MARSKTPPKPLFSVKHDFYESLDNLAQQSIMLIQAVEMTIKRGNLPEGAASILQERITAFRAALSSDE